MLVKVRVKTSKREIKKFKNSEGVLEISLTKRSVENDAHEQLINVLADYYKINRSSIRIKSGLTSRNKFIEIDNKTHL